MVDPPVEPGMVMFTHPLAEPAYVSGDRAAHAPTPRRPTKPTYASRQRRLEDKKKRGTVKSLRSSPFD